MIIAVIANGSLSTTCMQQCKPIIAAKGNSPSYDRMKRSIQKQPLISSYQMGPHLFSTPRKIMNIVCNPLLKEFNTIS